MQKKLAFLLLFFSLLLVMGHSMLPHNHYDKSFLKSQIINDTDLSLADLLRLTFSQNLGTNHLEEFRSCSTLEYINVSIQEFVVDSDPLLLISEFIIEKKVFHSYQDDYSQLGNSFSFFLRAPPSRL